MAEIDLGRPLRTVAVMDAAHETLLAVGDIDGQVHLLEAGNRLRRVSAFHAHNAAARRVRFTDDAWLTCGEDGRVLRRDLVTERSTVISTHDNFATDVLQLPGGRWWSCGYDGQIRSGESG